MQKSNYLSFFAFSLIGIFYFYSLCKYPFISYALKSNISLKIHPFRHVLSQNVSLNRINFNDRDQLYHVLLERRKHPTKVNLMPIIHQSIHLVNTHTNTHTLFINLSNPSIILTLDQHTFEALSCKCLHWRQNLYVANDATTNA